MSTWVKHERVALDEMESIINEMMEDRAGREA